MNATDYHGSAPLHLACQKGYQSATVSGVPSPCPCSQEPGSAQLHHGHALASQLGPAAACRGGPCVLGHDTSLWAHWTESFSVDVKRRGGFGGGGWGCGPCSLISPHFKGKDEHEGGILIVA